ncbi:MAG: phage prohead protease, family [Firmicutes bacterium]|nr:phage prohead protease, family [Bacillota bacterium]
MEKKIRQRRMNQTFYRDVSIDPTSIDTENRIVPVSFSSDQPIERYDWWDGYYNEILGHAKGNVDLTRLSDIGVALFNHDPGQPIGKVLSPVIDSKNRKGTALIQFDSDEASDVIYQKVLSGTLKGISVGYRVMNWESVDIDATSTDGLYQGPCEIARNWEPFEISVVSIPADSTVGVGRSMEEVEQKLSTVIEKIVERKLAIYEAPPEIESAGAFLLSQTGEVRQTNQEGGREVADKANQTEVTNIDERAIREEAARNERVRVTEIRAMFRSFADQTGLNEDGFIDNGVSVEEARKAIMEDLTKRKAAPVSQTPEIQFVADEEDKFRAAAVDALAWRSGLKLPKPAPGFEALRCVNMVDLGRLVYERSTGKRFESFDRDLLVREMVQSSVFSYILQNVADKAMQNAYQFAPVTYPTWTKHGVLNDYKPALRAQLSEVPLLENVGKGAEYKLITLTDAGEWIQLSKRGNLFSITREDILNDDMHALVDFPARWAAAARMTINQDVYTVINSNPTMGYDSTALFATAHNNIATANKTVPSKASLQAAIQAMMLQTGLKTSIPLNIRPKFLLSPVALMFGAKQLLQSTADPTAPNAGAVNVLQDIVQLVTDPLLDASSSTAWYLAADPSITDTIEVAFLNGQDSPYIEQQNGFQVDGFTYKIRIEYGVKALDWRGLFKNPGA